MLDEPTNHLAIRFQHEILDLVRSLAFTTILVLHDLNLAARYCDRLVLLQRGRVAAAGPVDPVLDPETVERVYDMSVRRVVDEDSVQLIFSLPTRVAAPL
jgi:iron complex transport system ATP-binding protein